MNNFYECVAAAAEKFPARIAIEIQRPERPGAGPEGVDALSYAELLDQASRVAAFLAAREIAPGDRCAILADNDARWCAAYFGILRLGAVAVPLDTAYKSKQVAALLHDSGAKMLFTSAKYLPAAKEPARTLGVEIILLQNVLLSSGVEALAHNQTSPADVARGQASFEEILARPLGLLPPCPCTKGDAAVMLYTSGTTSDPKGVVLTHGNLLAEMDSVFRTLQVDENDAILGVLPLFHALAQMANLLLPFAVGARVVYLETLNTTELLRALQERGITVFVCVPQFFYLIHERVLQQAKAAGWWKRKLFRALLRTNGFLRDIFGLNLGPRLFRRVHDVLGRRMRLLVTGGSRFEPKIGMDLHRLGFTILQAYGLTECSGAATVVRPGDSHIGSVGQALPGVEVRILPRESANSEEESPGGGAPQRDGEIAIRSGIVMQGYFNRPDVNAVTLRDAWLHTGDLGYLDSAGRVYITGRKKEIIVLSSGKNLYPEEIEAHYLQSPYIKEICVMGLARPDEPAAERLYAAVVPNFDVMRERKIVNTREILRYEIESLGVTLPSHKRVLGFDIWTEDLPRTTTRKLKRFEIERLARDKMQKAGAAASAPEAVPQTEEEIAWATDPDVARALVIIADAARTKGTVRPAANIELELGLDSMERVELLTHLQQVFGTLVPDEVSQKIYTVRDLVEAVRPQPGNAPASSWMRASTAAAGSESASDTWGRLLAAAPEDDPILTELLKPKPVVAALMFAVLKAIYALARLLPGFRVTGLEHLPPQGPFLLSPNHQSYLDAFLLVSALPFRVLRDTFFVGASEYFATPLMAWVARKINVVPVDPDTNLLRAMQAGAYGLRHGKVLIIFPEGERSIDGEPKKFKKGPAILSMRLQAPIVPVALDGVYELWPRNRPLHWRALVLRDNPLLKMSFGAPLPSPARLPEGTSLTQAEARYAQATTQLRDCVVEMWTVLRAE